MLAAKESLIRVQDDFLGEGEGLFVLVQNRTRLTSRVVPFADAFSEMEGLLDFGETCADLCQLFTIVSPRFDEHIFELLLLVSQHLLRIYLVFGYILVRGFIKSAIDFFTLYVMKLEFFVAILLVVFHQVLAAEKVRCQLLCGILLFEDEAEEVSTLYFGELPSHRDALDCVRCLGRVVILQLQGKFHLLAGPSLGCLLAFALFFPHHALVHFDEATLSKELPFAEDADVVITPVDRLFREAALVRDPTNFVVEYSSDASLGLGSLKKLLDSLVLGLCRYVSRSLPDGLELARFDDEDSIVCYAFRLEDLAAMRRDSCCLTHQTLQLLLGPVSEEWYRLEESDFLFDLGRHALG